VSREKDIQPVSCSVYFLPIETRVPLKFGHETLTTVTCVRVKITVEAGNGARAIGWGETPLNVQWAWPGDLSYEARHERMKDLCCRLAEAWVHFAKRGHPIELGVAFVEGPLTALSSDFAGMPWLAILICSSAFDIALHDAYGKIHDLPVYETYNDKFMNYDLSAFLIDATGGTKRFKGKYPADYLNLNPPKLLPAWHLLGGQDLVDENERTGNEPSDGYPVTLRGWIERDGLRCVKIKLRGNDAKWDYERLLSAGSIAQQLDVEWLSADFNCTVREPRYVNEILDRLMRETPFIYQKLLYVEQPFPYDLELNQIDVHSVSARKPLFMDESAHNWKLISLGRSLGWTGVALKTCKTQTGALLSLCWAKAHGMTLMVQDLTNPMLAQIPHVTLAQRAGTIMGVETNSMQFYPESSKPEARIHPGLFRRTNGLIDLSTIAGAGFGYRIDEIWRVLPKPVVEA
jgi:L-alanine-DL-glutamate epimerase-like enolase superfamily enzyme